MTENATDLGVWIRECLDEIGKNQAWLAEKIGVQPPQVSRIISGTSETSPETLVAIAEALGKPRIQIFRVAGYIENVPDVDKDIEEMANIVRKYPKADREEILSYIRWWNNQRNNKK